MKLISLVKEILNHKNEKEIARDLNVAVGTVKRWLLLDNVPSQYYLDLARISGREVDLGDLTYRDKDQFFTPTTTASQCFDVFKELLKDLGLEEEDMNYIEPSAGSGSFFNILPDDRKIGIDIEPRCAGLEKANFLDWLPKTKENNVVIGNPPFGLRGNLALRFMNHAATFADFVVFILPQLFESDGKGSPYGRVKGLNLLHSQRVSSDFSYPDGKGVKVNAVFQVWSKNFGSKEETKSCKEFIKVLSLSDGGSPSTTRNKDWLDKCDAYLPSTCYGSKNMKMYSSFEDLPNRKGYGIVFLKEERFLKSVFKNADWSKVAFESTNSALNLRTSIICNHVAESMAQNTSAPVAQETEQVASNH